jgi:uncharacterized protein (UPF0248 family)
MAKQYQVIWKSADLNNDTEPFDSVIVNDVQFRDQYVQIDMEDSENTVLYIPYYRIIEIKRTGQDLINDDYGHP